MKKYTDTTLKVESIVHEEDRRLNIPTAEYQSLMREEEGKPVRVAYDRRNRDLDPQLVWRGKDGLDWSDLVVQAPPLYIQEKIHPKALVDDLAKRTRSLKAGRPGFQPSLFDDFDGIPDGADKTEFYRHDQNWTNRMVLGDSLKVMASLAEREGLRGKVQCIYMDPPYGIRFNSNFQWSTTSRDVKDGKVDHITREPEQVKAFRDTWRDGVHSYLTYLRDRLTVCRDLLADSGSIFVQIGDENVHRVRCLMDEVFGEDNFCSIIQVQKTGSQAAKLLANTVDFILWFAKSKELTKYRQLYNERIAGHVSSDRYDQIELEDGTERRLKREEIERMVPLPEGRVFRHTSLISAGLASAEQVFTFEGRAFQPGSSSHWKTTLIGLEKLVKAGRVAAGPSTVRYKRFIGDFAVLPITDRWESLQIGTGLIYVVQTSTSAVERCILMATDPGDLVLDPTCGSGTTAYVAEQWGRRWITIDTSRVALALARARVMGARYPYYLLADSPEGRRKEAEVREQWRVASEEWRAEQWGAESGEQSQATDHSSLTTRHSPLTTASVRMGFVYERVPHVTLKSIANNAEIDVIWEKWRPEVQEALDGLNAALRGHEKPFRVTTGGREGRDVRFDSPQDATFTLPSGETVPACALLEWEVPREPPPDWPPATTPPTALFWKARVDRQKEVDRSIAAKAESEYLYDRPYEDKKTVRVAGPFTVESVSPHRALAVGADGELIDPVLAAREASGKEQGFVQMVLEYLRTSGVQQAHKGDRIAFTSLVPWPGELVCAEGGIVVSDKWPVVSDKWPVASGQGAGEVKTVEGKGKRRPSPATPPPLTTDPPPLTTDHQPLTTDHQPLTTDHQPLTTDHQPLTTDHQPLTTDHQPLTTDHQPLTTDHQPLTTALRAAVFIGPEFGTVSRPDLVAAAREACDAGFDVLVACAFNYDAHSTEFAKLGRVPVLKARMNADLHMADDLKNTGKGNLFVIFGEPDVAVASEEWIVDSSGRRTAPYEIFKLVSGTGSLAEINRLGRQDLQFYTKISCRREIWDDIADAAGGDVRPGEHRRGAGAQEHGGVSSVAWHCAGLLGGAGNVPDFVRSAGLSGRSRLRERVERLRRDQQDAERPDQIALHSPLTTSHSPLTTGHSPLTTSHSPLTTLHYSQITVLGVDVFHPSTGEIRSDGPEGIACWFVDTDYNEESFFVRHAYFLGANDPYKSLKTSLRAEVDEEAWASLHSAVSRPFERPPSGRVAVKVINHLGDEVMKVFRVP